MEEWEKWWVAENAFYKWQQSGCPDGRSEEFWYAAEEELKVWKQETGLKFGTLEFTNDEVVIIELTKKI